MQGYLKNGYNRATEELMGREFLGMRVEIDVNKITIRM